MEELVKLLTENNARLTTQVEAQAEQIKSLNEQLAYLTKKLFGSSSEKTTNDNQLSLFEDAQVFNRRRQPKKKPSSNVSDDVKNEKV